MKLNLQLVKMFWLLQQFKSDVHHKLEKEHIIPDALSRLASINVSLIDPNYLKFNTLFMYNATFVEIYPTLVLRILAEYKANNYCSRLQY